MTRGRRSAAILLLAGGLFATAGVTAAVPGASTASPDSADASWRHAAPGHDWSFPRDHHAHPAFRTEWWYVTGLLRPADGAPVRLAFQWTLFRVGLLPATPPLASAWRCRDLVLGHLAVTDPVAGRHLFREVLWRGTPLLAGTPPPPDPLLAWCVAPAGTDGRWSLALAPGDTFRLRAADAGSGLALDLALVPLTPPVLQGDGGFSAKNRDGDRGSLYYSLPRLATAGTVVLDGDTLRLTGTSWLDREFTSDPLAGDLAGWDWFGLRLRDGRALTLYVLRDAAGRAAVTSSTLAGPDGRTVRLTPGDGFLTVTDHWTSPRTGARYPSRWRLRLPAAGLDLVVTPLLPDQENVGTRSGVVYWEGAVSLHDPAGRPAGEGYVELTGYGAGRLPFP